MTSTDPLVSLVVPTYNRAAFLPETLDSLLALEYPNVEIVVVDDGSTDDTSAVLDRYARRGNVVVMHQPNAGQATALNRGWAHSRGELLGTVSSDDPQPAGMLAPLVEHLLDHPEVVLVYPDFDIIGPDGGYLGTIRSPDFSFANMLAWSMCFPGPGTLFRRKVLDQAGGWDPAYPTCPDFEWYFRVALVGPFARVPRVLAQWRRHSDSITSSSSDPDAARLRMSAVESFLARSDLPAEVLAVRGEALRAAYIVAAHVASAELPGPGARFEVHDRISDRIVELDEGRLQPGSLLPETQIARLSKLADEQHHTIDWLHAEVAERDRTIDRLHAEVALRDREIAALRAMSTGMGT